jgi:hypothetical protein
MGFQNNMTIFILLKKKFFARIPGDIYSLYEKLSI